MTLGIRAAGIEMLSPVMITSCRVVQEQILVHSYRIHIEHEQHEKDEDAFMILFFHYNKW